MDNQIVALSDLHLGEPNSVLFWKYPNLIEKFVTKLKAITGESIGTLILMGDLPDYTLASWEICHRNLKMFFDALLLGKFQRPDEENAYIGAEIKIDKIVYLPGNHDHALWTHILKNVLPSSEFEINKPKNQYYSIGKLSINKSGQDWDYFWSGDIAKTQQPKKIMPKPFLFHNQDKDVKWSTGRDHGFNAEVQLHDYIFSADALKKVQTFEIQNPLYIFENESASLLFHHGQYFKEIIVGSESEYDFSIIKSSVMNDLKQKAEDIYHNARKKYQELKKYYAKWEKLLGELEDCLKSKPFCVLKKKSLIEIEKETAIFMDNLWAPAENDNYPIRDKFWNLVGLFENNREEIDENIRFYLKSLCEIDEVNKLFVNQKELAVVFGDTHCPGELPNVVVGDAKMAKVFNTGAWLSKNKCSPLGMIFTYPARNYSFLHNIRFEDKDLSCIKVWDENQ